MSDSVRPQRQQPTRLPSPWDSPGKNTGVGCHFLLQCMNVKSESEVAQSCLTLSNPMDGSSVHGTFSPFFEAFSSISILNIVVCIHGEGNGTPLQYSCLENPVDGGAWWAAVHGIGKSQTRLSDFTFTFHFHALEKEMATHSSVLAWRIPGTGEPGGLLSVG